MILVKYIYPVGGLRMHSIVNLKSSNVISENSGNMTASRLPSSPVSKDMDLVVYIWE